MRSFLHKSLTALFPLVILAQGCTQEDLEAVKSLAPTAIQIKQQGTEVIQDLHGSCVRGEHLKLRNRELQLGDHIDDFIPVVIMERCDSFREGAYSTEQLNNILASYITSLVRLASNQTVTFNENLAILGGSITNLADSLDLNITQSAIGETTGIANSLLNMWSANFRREQLLGILVCTDKPLQQFVSLLDLVVQDTYLNGRLQDESQSIIENISTRYRLAYNNLQADRINVDEFIGQRNDLERELERSIQDLIQRQEKARDYQKILNTTIETHQSIAKLFAEGMTSEEVAFLCEAYLSADENLSKRASKRLSQVTTDQLSEAKEVLEQHVLNLKNIIHDRQNEYQY